MVSITYQAVFKIDYNSQKILELLKETYIEGGIDFEINESNFVINYCRQIDSEKYVLGFSMDFQEEDAEKVIKLFSENLIDLDECLNLIKLNDGFQKEKYKKIFEDIYNIEMKMRELLTLAFIDSYKSDFHNLLKEIDVKLEEKEIMRNENTKRQRFNSAFENEFFYLNFSKYKSLDKLKNLTHEDLFEFVESSNEFKEFKEKVTRRGAIKEYGVFLLEIKSLMDKLEKIRNCIMHSRILSNDLNDYKDILDKVKKKLEIFEISIKTPISARLLIKELTSNSYSWEVLLEYEKVPKEIRNLGEIKILGGPEYQTEEFEREIKDSLLNRLEDLDYNIEELDKEMIEVVEGSLR